MRRFAPTRHRLAAVSVASLATLVGCRGAVGDRADPGADAAASADAGVPPAGGPDAGSPVDTGSMPASGAGGGAGTRGAGGAGADARPEAGSGGSAGSGAGGSAGAGASGGGVTVAMFVAQGSVERTTISCDDGLTWVANQSADDSLRCYSNGNMPDCDHGETAARGLAYGGGWFFASFGWGAGGPLERSRDGVTWEVALTPNQQGTIAFGDGRVLGSDHYSDDLGATWQKTPGAAVGVTRNVGFIPQAGGHFLLIGDNGTFVSNGSSFTKVTTGCGAGFTLGSGAVSSATTTIVVNSDGVACRTTDGGVTWNATSVGGAVLSHPVWDGSAFRVWGQGKMYRSPDGAAWTATSTTPSSLKIESVARSAETGTFVAVRSEWLEWYGSQVFYRSGDGITWTAIPKTSFTGSHPIYDIEFGYGAPSSVCPGK